MEPTTLDITFIAAPDDLRLQNPTYQDELHRFKESLESNGIEVSFAMRVRESGGGPNGVGFMIQILLGDFTVKLAVAIVPALITAVAGWIVGKNGRKVRLKIGDIEAEAQTVEDVEHLIARAEEILQSNRPKTIHES